MPRRVPRNSTIELIGTTLSFTGSPDYNDLDAGQRPCSGPSGTSALCRIDPAEAITPWLAEELLKR